MAAQLYWQLINAMGGGDAVVRRVPPELRGLASLMIQPGKVVGDAVFRKIMEEAHGRNLPPDPTGERGSMGMPADEQGPPTEEQMNAVYESLPDYMQEYQRTGVYDEPPTSENYFSNYARGGTVMPPYYSLGGWRLI